MIFRILITICVVFSLVACVAEPADDGEPVVVEEKDSDQDGVFDNRDNCPGTPPNANVDQNGCTIIPSQGQQYYVDQCLDCHGTAQGRGVVSGGALTQAECADDVDNCSNLSLLVAKIRDDMPVVDSTTCDQECAEEVADYIFKNFDGYGGQVPDTDLSITLEVEEGALEGNIDPDSATRITFTTSSDGTQYASYLGKDNTVTFYRQALPIPGRYSVAVHYAADGDRSLTIDIDDVSYDMNIASSGGWEIFTQSEIEVVAKTKIVDIRLGSDSTQWSANVDKLIFTLIEAKEPEPLDCSQNAFGTTPLQRLNKIEYRNSIHELLGMSATVDMSALPSDTKIGNFRANTIAPLGENGFEKLMLVAENIAGQATDNAQMLTGCQLDYGEEAFALNIGGGEYTSTDGITYQADPMGLNYVTENDVAVLNSEDDPIYNTARDGNYTLNVPVLNGRYHVIAHLAEPFWCAGTRPCDGERVFDLYAEENLILDNLDIVSETGERYLALDKAFEVEVSDGEFNLRLQGGGSGNKKAVISGIRLRRIFEGEIGINVGGNAHTSSDGIAYQADNYGSGGNQVSVGAGGVKLTVDDAVYGTALWNDRLNYNIPLQSGLYRVTVQLMENYFNGDPNPGGIGARVFDVSAEGDQVLQDIDIFASVGFETAYDESFEIEVSDGTLNLEFVASASNVLLAGIIVQPLAVNNQTNQYQCINDFIKRFATKAFRRPATSEEIRRYNTTYFDTVDEQEDASQGFQALVASILQSPNFLYRIEGSHNRSAFLNGDVVPLTAHELAARLSFFLWGSTPNDELMALAESGELLEPARYAEQVDRMLADNRSHVAIHNFYEQWLEIEDIEGKEKAPEFFPSYTAELGQAMLKDTLDFIDDVYLETAPNFANLFAPGGFTYTQNPELLSTYGVSASANGSPVALPSTQRSGLLTQASVMTMFSHSSQSSPVLRGAYVRDRFLCQKLPSPPADVNDTVPPISPDATTRERFDLHRTEPKCANCHALIDPVGYPLEAFDAIGQFRVEENGKTLDLTGDLFGTDITENLDGPIELSAAISNSEVAQACFVENWLEYSLNRLLDKQDSCVADELTESFISSGGNLKELIKQVAESKAFKNTRVQLGGNP